MPATLPHPITTGGGGPLAPVVFGRGSASSHVQQGHMGFSNLPPTLLPSHLPSNHVPEGGPYGNGFYPPRWNYRTPGRLSQHAYFQAK